MDKLDPVLLSGFELYKKGQIENALHIAQDALKQDPHNAVAYLLSGNCYFTSGNLEQSITEYKKSLKINPSLKEALIQLAKALSNTGQIVEAVGMYKKLWDLDRSNTIALLAMGEALTSISAWTEAEQTLQIALKINPKLSMAHVLFGKIARERDAKMIEAIAHCRRAIEINPDDAAAYTEMGVAFLRAGDPLSASMAFKKNLSLKGKNAPRGYSNWLFSQQFLENISQKELFKHHCGWQNSNEPDWKQQTKIPFHNIPNPEKKLKVGFASADLYTHSVSYFLSGLFEHYDREKYEFICFSNRNPALEDQMSQTLKGFVDKWLVIDRMPPAKLYHEIRQLGVDILVDLSGHAGKNILPVFMRRAAPVQTTWLGYPDTTGLDTMDFRMVDSVTDPEPRADAYASEQLYRLPPPFLCYQPEEESRELEIKPQTNPEKIVFGTFNKSTKFSPSVLRLWSEILRKIPQAELLLKCQSFREEQTRAFVVDNLKKYGIEENRIKLLGFLPSHKDHMSAYNLMDVALDTIPYNGTTTSCEALWMGVPLITKEGERHSSRVGKTLLTAVGLEDWVTSSNEEYVAKAVECVQKRDQLRELKQTLRSRMQGSTLCDHVEFARKFESALRQMWKAWCEEMPPTCNN